MRRRPYPLWMTLPLSLAALSALLGCANLMPASPRTTSSPEGETSRADRPSQGRPSQETITDEDGQSLTITRGAQGDPGVVGCADGQREGLLDTRAYPRIAACMGTWSGAKSLRDAPTGRGCGDGLGPCASPADLCAPGWHICGKSGSLAELKQLSAQQCREAGAARFSAALSHCETQEGCTYDDPNTGGDGDGRYACFESGWCSEPVCCGQACGELGACTDGVWPGATTIAQGTDQGCAQMTARRAGGVLCCQD